MNQIFSDKTGTLTCNVMEFRQFSAGMYSYGSSEVGRKMPNQTVPNVNFQDEKFYLDFSQPGYGNYDCIQSMLLGLALNHSVVVEQDTSE